MITQLILLIKISENFTQLKLIFFFSFQRLHKASACVCVTEAIYFFLHFSSKHEFHTIVYSISISFFTTRRNYLYV